MSTTTIRLSEELKARVARAAESAGTTAHSFMLEAIADRADAIELRTDFHAQAEQRFAGMIASGKSLAWSDVRAYLEDKAAGKAVSRPKARRAAK